MDLPRDFGPYRLLKQIAVGGMAEIYLAKTSGFGGFEKFLALKMIHPKFSEDDHFVNMLVEEAKISVQLAHVNIGQVFDLGRIGENYYIAMEYIEGADIYKMMRRAAEIGVDVPVDSCAHVAGEVCAGLDYAHRKRDSNGKSMAIIHRDMSPQNVLISFAGEVKIVDFGIAKAALRAQQTEVGIIKGKYYYMSPEQAWGDTVDHRTDIFSAGIIIYEMLTGQMLYLEDNIDILLDRVRKAEIDPPSSKREEVPEELDGVVMKALSKYPDDRYQSAREFGQALSGFLYAFSPDYTPARLAGIMTWLLEDEREGGEPEVKPPSSEDSILLTRDDFIETSAPSGSLLFDLAHVENAADMDGSDEGMGMLDKTALVQSPPVHRETAALDLPDGAGDETAQVAMSGEGPGSTHDDDRFQFFSQTFDSADDESPWGDDEDGSTLVEPEDRMLHRMADAAGILRRSSAASPQPRSASDQTRKIEPGDIASSRPPRPSRPPPSAPPKSGFTVPPPRPSEPPPPDEDDEDDFTGLAPGVSPRPSALPGPAAEPLDVPAPAPEPAPPAPPPPPPPNPPLEPGGPRAAPPLPAPPPPSPGRPEPRAPEPPKAPPPLPGPPPSAGPPAQRPPSDVDAAAMAAALMEDHTGPTFVSSLGNLAPGAGEGDTDPTSLVRSPMEAPPGLEGDTGPTQLAPGLLDGDTGPTHISTDALDDDTGPTTMAPTMSPAAAAAASRSAPPLGEDSSRPPAPRESRSPGPSGPGGAVGPSPPNQPAPWLMGGGPFSPSRSEPPPPPTSPDAEMLDSDLPEAPHDEGALAGPFARTTALRNMWRAATTPIGVKILLAVGVLVAIVITAVLVWPRPQPLARLDIRSHPPGAQVFLDGEPLPGLTPTSVDELELESVHQVELRLNGFSPWSQPVRMDAERVRQIAVLSPIRGILRVTSDPPGASVYVDGVYQGVTPREVDGLDINRPIEVQARLETRSQAQTISWDGRTEATVNFVFADTTRRRRPYR